jgi:rhamnopyranosyl-N-acetylglucosaminyl-diphospho-decaprenol beta-1,3/1,4-galactofuranosyltransferase
MVAPEASRALRSKVVAVVPTYNRKVLVSQCLAALLTQTAPVAGVVIVDNASSDGTREYLEEQGLLDDRRVEVLRLEVNTGSAGAFRAGMERASVHEPDWIWMIDDDAIAFPDTLQKLLAEASSRGETDRVAFTSYQLQFDGNAITYRLPRSVVEALRYGLGCPFVFASPGNEEAIPVDWFPFVSALIPGSAVSEVGLPAESLFYYHEDLEYSLRIREKGYSAFLVPSSLVDHRKATMGRADLPGWKLYYLYRNTVYVARFGKHQLGTASRAAAVARITAGGLSWIARDLLRGSFRRAGLTTRGLIDGFRNRIGPTVRS